MLRKLLMASATLLFAFLIAGCATFVKPNEVYQITDADSGLHFKLDYFHLNPPSEMHGNTSTTYVAPRGQHFICASIAIKSKIEKKTKVDLSGITLTASNNKKYGPVGAMKIYGIISGFLDQAEDGELKVDFEPGPDQSIYIYFAIPKSADPVSLEIYDQTIDMAPYAEKLRAQ